MITQRTYTVDEAFQLALKIEKHLKQPLTRRFPSQAEETPLRKIDLRAPTMQPNYKVNATIGDQRKEGKDHCFKCGEKGRMAMQCPKKNWKMERVMTRATKLDP